MLDACEASQIQHHARTFAGHPMMPVIHRAIAEHFTTPEASACRTLRDQLRGQPGEPTRVDLVRFCAVLRELFAA
jgi:hypothetical protein